MLRLIIFDALFPSPIYRTLAIRLGFSTPGGCIRKPTINETDHYKLSCFTYTELIDRQLLRNVIKKVRLTLYLP